MNTGLVEALRQVADALELLEHDWALVGGMAVSMYVEPRFTRDIDIAISVGDDGGTEQFIHSWMTSGFNIRSVIEHDVKDRLATVRSESSKLDGDVIVDLLFASSGIEPEIASQSQTMDFVPGVRVPVARPGHLFALKLLSMDESERPQDSIDLNRLAERLDHTEREAARHAVELIEHRGFQRGRNLTEMYEDWCGK